MPERCSPRRAEQCTWRAAGGPRHRPPGRPPTAGAPPPGPLLTAALRAAEAPGAVPRPRGSTGAALPPGDRRAGRHDRAAVRRRDGLEGVRRGASSTAASATAPWPPTAAAARRQSSSIPAAIDRRIATTP